MIAEAARNVDDVRLEVVDPHGDALTTRRGHQLGGLLDRLRPVHLRALLARGPAGHVHGHAQPTQLDRDGPAGRPRTSGDERHLVLRLVVRHAGHDAGKT